jgi:pilus assembly protein CpaE
MTDLRVLLATPHAGYEQRVRRAFGAELNGDLRRWDLDQSDVTPEGLVQQLAHSTPDVVAIGPDVELPEALALARQLEQDRPEISVLLISEMTSDGWQQALRSGVHDVLAPDAVDAEVRTAFNRALDVAARRRHNLVGDPAGAVPSGRIITVLSPKGGSGKTTVSANLAVGLAMAEPDQTVVVDLDLQFGDIATALRLTPEHTLADVVRAPSPVEGMVLDGMFLKSFLSSHPSGLWALCGPETPAEGEEVGADQARQVVQALADEFRYVIVDTGAGLSEHALSVLEVSTDLLLLCAMDVPSVRSLRKEIDALDQLGMTEQHRHLVINRADSKVGLDLDDVQAIIGMPVDVAVPSTRAVPLSLNQGTPVIESEPRSPVARQLAGLVERFAEQTVSAAGRRRRRGGGR